MEFIAFTNNFFGTGKTKQRALINVLEELEQNNAQARCIKFSKVTSDTDAFIVMESGFYNEGMIKLS